MTYLAIIPMKSKRFVMDTNIFISRLLLIDSISSQVVRHILDNSKVVVTDDTLQELSSVLLRSKFDKYVSLKARELFIEGVKSVSIHAEVKRFLKVCRDPKDNKILEAAVNGNAEVIITGDQDLLVLKEFEEVKIIKPQDFLRYTKIS
jgi:putative PIN family toxin of toxin-antitoxin system